MTGITVMAGEECCIHQMVGFELLLFWGKRRSIVMDKEWVGRRCSRER